MASFPGKQPWLATMTHVSNYLPGHFEIHKLIKAFVYVLLNYLLQNCLKKIAKQFHTSSVTVVYYFLCLHGIYYAMDPEMM